MTKTITKSTNVILYCRVSSDEQKEGCSLDMQERFLRAYCTNNGYNIINVYHEDHSAKSHTLDRPVLKSIYDYCKKHPTEVGKVLFLRWDRFSRNLEFALTYKRKFVDELCIEINSMESTIDFSGAEWSTLLGIYCGVAHTEDIKISKRTMDGIHGTLLKGKWSNRAPRGYKNVRHAKHDTEVIIDPTTASRVREAFEEVACGVESLNTIRKKLFPKVPKSAFSAMLRNVFYVGLVHVPAYGDDPEQNVKGVHEALISQQTFDRVQEIVDGRRRNQPKVRSKIPHPDFFLRNLLICPICGHAITASHSKGRAGVLYPYYHCASNQKHFRQRAEETIDNFIRYVSHLKPSIEVLTLYKEVLNSAHKDEKDFASKEAVRLTGEVDAFRQKMAKVQDLFIDGELTKEEKTSAMSRYQKEVDSREFRIQTLKYTYRTKIKDDLEYAISLINNIENLISDAPTMIKIRLIGSIFPEKLEYDGKSYRTTRMNKLLEMIYQQTNELRKPKKEKTERKLVSFSSVPGTGLEPALLAKYAPETYASTNSATRALLSKESIFAMLFPLVPRTRLELARRYRHYPLKVACIPISPPGLSSLRKRLQKYYFFAN